MAFMFTFRPLFFVVILISFTAFYCRSEDHHEGDGDPSTDVSRAHHEGDGDPSTDVSRAFHCFNDKSKIYSSCDESYRLSHSGYLNVPPEATNQFCEGPCLKETEHVLDCISNMLSNFEFFNRATVEVIRATLESGCSSGDSRGNFDVMEHMESNAWRISRCMYMNCLSMIFILAWMYIF